jgi:phosphoribosyl-dephospho-CoA transferase
MVMNTEPALRTHDLLLFPAAAYDDELPDWVDREDGYSWAVVRRQKPTREGIIAAGLRGRQRSERKAIELRVDDVLRKASPEDLVSPDALGLSASGVRESLETIAAHSATWFGGRAWGPTGSVGFQLATQLPVVRESSDLDLIVRVDAYLAPSEARSILDNLAKLPCRVDCLLEMAFGAVALAEWAGSSNSDVLLRTANGPSLTKNPWSSIAEARGRVPA